LAIFAPLSRLENGGGKTRSKDESGLALTYGNEDQSVERVRVLLADDHKDFRAVTARLLEPEFAVVKMVSDGQTLVKEVARLQPDVVVMDVSMPGLNGIEAARHLRAAGATAKIVCVTVHRDPDYVQAALAAGVQGYVAKCQLATDLLLALRSVLAGRFFISPCLCPASTGVPHDR
jgi:DNA-binding NarL/FixJ family response regulator